MIEHEFLMTSLYGIKFQPYYALCILILHSLRDYAHKVCYQTVFGYANITSAG